MMVSSSGSTLVPLKQGLDFEFYKWKKLSLREIYPLVNRSDSNRINLTQ